MHEQHIGILGATSLVGTSVLSKLSASWPSQLFAYSRKPHESSDKIQWRKPSLDTHEAETIENWLVLAPIWVLSDYYGLLNHHQARRVVCLSTTSLFTKTNSSDLHEQELVKRISEAEANLQSWAAKHDVEWVVLRPTLIYGYGKDTNISEIARFIKRFGFFPVFGKAQGLRQPIHANDVAQACVTALNNKNIKKTAYNISGAEVLTYHDMVKRIFAALNRPPRIFSVPIGIFRVAVACLKFLPRYRHWTPAMVERMNQNLAFEHQDAERDLGFKPRKFVLSEQDLPD